MSANILIIDDEDLFREDLASLLRDEGFDCRTAGTGAAGLELAKEWEPAVVLCDLMMPGMDGVAVADQLAFSCPQAAVILVTAYGSMSTAVDAFRAGVVDYLLKPLVPEDLINKVRRCITEQHMQRELRYLRRVASHDRGGDKIVGECGVMNDLRSLIAKVAPADSAVLISGESGTGKELVARALHEGRWGVDRPFIAVNCAAVPRDLFESELFGHVRGAFTGAVSDRPGYFELARGGTLFLDEIGDLPLDLQPKLLRAIEQGEFMPVGGRKNVTVETRIVTATNRDLDVEVGAGRFREDLMYRIRVVEIALPPLRERRSDIPILVEHLLHRVAERSGRQPPTVEHAAIGALTDAEWRGNVRELENVLERAVLLAEGPAIGLEDLPPELSGDVGRVTTTADLREATRAFERRHIERVLREVGGSREEASKKLGINPSTLYRRLKELEL